MVNVGGRSKGCSTCRRRKVKCDENRPVCNRCQRTGLQCEGVKGTTFVQGTIVKSRRTIKQETALARRDDINDAGNAYPVDHQIPPTVSLRGKEDEIYLCYTLKPIRGGLVESSLQGTQLNDLITAGPATAGLQVFHQAILSFAAIFFGTQHRQASIANQGYVMHGVALKELNQALSEPNCYTRDEVILSVVTFALMECFVPTGPRHYLKHMIGLEKLLELRDPASHCSPRSSEIYRGVRHMILFASLRTGKPSILARPEWKKALRANCSPEEEPEQDLCDVLADCTVLVAERDIVLADWVLELEGVIHQRNDIQRRAIDLLTQLRVWRERWDSDARNQNFEIQSLGDFSPPFLTIFRFLNDSAAIMLMFYNTTLIYVLRVLSSLPPEDISPHPHQHSTQNTTTPNDEYLNAPQKLTQGEYLAAEWLAALEICRCVPYYLVRVDERSGSGLSPLVHLAVATAWVTLGGNESPEGRWMTGLLNTATGEVSAKGLRGVKALINFE